MHSSRSPHSSKKTSAVEHSSSKDSRRRRRRSHARRHPDLLWEGKLPRREKWIASLSALTLILSALAYSTVPLWAQWWVFGLSALTFLCLFLPVGYDGLLSNTPLESWRRLRRFPIFWLGLLLFGLMLVQSLNPAWTVEVGEKVTRVRPEPEHVGWLPIGVDAPFSSEVALGGMNGWRQMLIMAGPWLLLCAWWAGMERRRSWVGVAWAVLVVGLILVGWGAQMRIGNTWELNGLYNHGNTSFFATFLYQNQAAAWYSLLFALAVGMALWHWERAVAGQANKGGPHFLASGFAVMIALGMVFTLSFGGMLTLAVLLLVCTPVAVLWDWIRHGVEKNLVIGLGVSAMLLAVVAGVFAATSDLQEVETKLRRKFDLAQKKSLDDRAPLRRATWSLITYRDNDYLLYGYGAGSYRWLSPGFMRQQPEFRNKQGKLTHRTNYAHCDWLQIVAEWGSVGFGLVTLGLLWAAWRFLRAWRRWTPVVFMLGAGALLFLAHAWMDFLIYSPPLLGLFFFVALAAYRIGLKPATSS